MYFGNKTFKDVKTHLLITSVDITTMTPRFYKSDYNKNYSARVDESLADVIVASASAPTYFSEQSNLKHSMNLIDGGIVATNPSLVALIDALNFNGKDKTAVTLLSIGTGCSGDVPYDSNKLLNAGLKEWAKPIIEFLMGHLKLKEHYKRINPTLGEKIELDDVSKLGNLKNISDLSADDIDWIINNLTGEIND